jgi:hypothetical protein
VSGDACVGGGLGYNRALCIESTVQPRNCRWAGVPSGCVATCAPGELLISQNSWIGGANAGCLSGSYSSFCCSEITVSPSSLSTCGYSNTDIVFSGGLVNYKRGSNYRMNPIWGTGLECVSYGEASVYMPSYFSDPTPGFQPASLILNTNPGLWQWNPIWETYAWTPLGNLPYPPKGPADACTTTITVTSESTITTSSIATRTCNGNYYPQACLHYSSVQDSYVGLIDTLYCKVTPTESYRSAPSVWDKQHTVAWRYWVPKFNKPNGKEDTCNK